MLLLQPDAIETMMPERTQLGVRRGVVVSRFVCGEAVDARAETRLRGVSDALSVRGLAMRTSA